MKQGFISKTIALIIAAAITMGIWTAIRYLFVIPITIHSSGMWFALIVTSFISSLTTMGIFALFEEITDTEFDIGRIVMPLITVVLLVGWIIAGITSAEMFKAKEYAGLIEVQEGALSEDVAELTDDIVYIDYTSAQKMGDRTIGSIPNASWYEVSNEYNLVKIKGTYYRISALEYSSLGSYNKAKDSGIPGYVLVQANATDQVTAKYVELENKIFYSPSAYWSMNLERHLRKQYPGLLFAKSFFEVDEEGTPYWITGVYTTNIGCFGGKKIDSAILTNATTGEATVYQLDEIPEWVDQVMPIGYLMSLIDNHYSYQGGWINSWWNKTNVYRTAYSYKSSGFAGYNSLVDANGKVMHYTSITPSNKAETNIGFVLVDPVTAKVDFYKIENASEESSAQGRAEGTIQQMGYKASFPIIVTVDGEPTYFMTLKDSLGSVQRFALVNIRDYNRCAVNVSISETLTQYKKVMNMEVISPTEDVETYETTGTISVLSVAEMNGTTCYYFMLENNENTFISSLEVSHHQPLSMKEGVEVTITYYPLEENIMVVNSIEFK